MSGRIARIIQSFIRDYQKQQNMKLFVKMGILVILLSACSPDGAREDAPLQEKRLAFDSLKWRTKEGHDYPFRNVMLDDLIESSRLKLLSWEELTNLLGPPDRVDSLYLFYTVDQTRIQGWPLHTKTMVVKFNADSAVHWVKIHE